MFHISAKDKTDANQGLPPHFGDSYGVTATFVGAQSGHYAGDYIAGSGYENTGIITGQQFRSGFGPSSPTRANVSGTGIYFRRGVVCNEIIVWFSGGNGVFDQPAPWPWRGNWDYPLQYTDGNLSGFSKVWEATGYVNLYTLEGELITGLSGTGGFGASPELLQDDNIAQAFDQKSGLVAIGAPWDGTLMGSELGGLTDWKVPGGAVYIYDTGGAYINKIDAPPYATGFGSAVAIINSELLVVGAPGSGNVSGDLPAGAAYVFTTGGDLMASISGLSHCGTQSIIGLVPVMIASNDTFSFQLEPRLSTAGLPVSFSGLPLDEYPDSPRVTEGGFVTIYTGGLATTAVWALAVTASQTGNEDYDPAADVTLAILQTAYSPYPDYLPGLVGAFDSTDIYATKDNVRQTLGDFPAGLRTSEWNDLSPSGNDVTQDYAASRPTYSDSGEDDGFVFPDSSYSRWWSPMSRDLYSAAPPSVVFSGDQFLSGEHSLGLTGNPSFDIFIVAHQEAVAPQTVLAVGNVGNNGEFLAVDGTGAMDFGDGKMIWRSGMNTGDELGTTGFVGFAEGESEDFVSASSALINYRLKNNARTLPGAAPATYSDVECYYNGNQLTGFLVGSDSALNLPTDNLTTLIGSLTGGGGVGVSGLSGSIAEILIFNRALLNLEAVPSPRNIIEGYLAYKWGFENYLGDGSPWASQIPGFVDNDINFSALSSVANTAPPFELSGYSDALQDLTYVSSDTDVATIEYFEQDGISVVTIQGPGTTTITASQAPNLRYSAPTPVDQDLIVI